MTSWLYAGSNTFGFFVIWITYLACCLDITGNVSFPSDRLSFCTLMGGSFSPRRAAARMTNYEILQAGAHRFAVFALLP